MRIRYRRLVFPAAAALLIAVLASGCGGGGSSSSGDRSGVAVTATISGNIVSITAHTDRSDIAKVWAEVTGVASTVSLTGSGQNWSGSVAVTAQANTVVTVKVYAQDSLGNVLGPGVAQVKTGEFGTQPTVTGTVVNRDDNKPVVGATVTLGGQTTATDASGRFVLTGLLAGTTQEGVITKSGFAEARFTVNVTAGTVDVGRITLTATQDLPPPVAVFP